jgi:hypothetical protein
VLGQLGGRARAGRGERLVQAEPVADHDGRRLHGRAEVDDEPAEELLEPLLLDSHLGHLLSLGLRRRRWSDG